MEKENDIQALREIIDRNGAKILFEVLSAKTKEACEKFDLNESDKDKLLWSYTKDLRETFINTIY